MKVYTLFLIGLILLARNDSYAMEYNSSTKELFRELLVAIIKGEIGKVSAIIEKRPFLINTYDTLADGPDTVINFMTPLMYACQHGQQEIVEYLANYPGIMLEMEDKKGKTAIFYIIGSGKSSAKQVKILEILFKAGINMDHKDYKHRTPLEYAKSLNPTPIRFNQVINFLEHAQTHFAAICANANTVYRTQLTLESGIIRQVDTLTKQTQLIYQGLLTPDTLWYECLITLSKDANCTEVELKLGKKRNRLKSLKLIDYKYYKNEALYLYTPNGYFYFPMPQYLDCYKPTLTLYARGQTAKNLFLATE